MLIFLFINLTVSLFSSPPLISSTSRHLISAIHILFNIMSHDPPTFFFFSSLPSHPASPLFIAAYFLTSVNLMRPHSNSSLFQFHSLCSPLLFPRFPSHPISFNLISFCAEEPDVRTRKIVKVVTQTMVNGKVVDESSEVEQIEETKK